VEKRENGTYTLALHLSDDVDDLMELRVMVNSEEQAKALADKFRETPEEVYQKLMAALLEA